MDHLRIVFLFCLSLVLCTGLFAAANEQTSPDHWSNRELALIQSLSLDSLGPRPADPSNAYADNPAAAALGEQIFFDPRFSANGTVSCSTCHRPDYGFTDPNTRSVGIGVTERRSMPLVGMAYQDWFAWDGRNDSLWSQSLEPFEDPVEHGIDRFHVAETITRFYKEDYERIFGALPTLKGAAGEANNETSHRGEAFSGLSEMRREQGTRVFVNVGKSLAAYIRSLRPQRTAFDRYADALSGGTRGDINALTDRQKGGLRLFLNEGSCVNCHNGPLFSNGAFHRVGVAPLNAVDQGRAAVIDTLFDNEFGYFTQWSDADPVTDGAHLRYLDATPTRFRVSFKTPSLRNVAVRPPYMHTGQLANLSAVLDHYRTVSGTDLADELFHLDLTTEAASQIEAFLSALTSMNNR